MRFLVLVPLALVLLAAAAFAQGAGDQPRIPPGWTAEDWQAYNQLQKAVGEALEYKDHEAMLAALDKQLPLLEKAIAALEKHETSGEDEEKQKKGVLAMYKGWVSGNFYNRACCLSLLEQKDKALAALKKAIEFGFMDLDKFRIDSDLDNIRNTQEYKDLLASLDFNEVYEVYKPEGVETPAGIIIALHWARNDEKKFLERFKPVADKTKMIFVVPRAPVTIAPGQYDWSRRSDDKETGLKKIRFVLAEVRKKEGMADLPVYLLGIGGGGDFATRAALTMPKEFKGAVQVNSYWNKYFVEDELPKAKEAGVKIALIHGKEHPSFDRVKAGVAQLEAAGVPGKLIEFEGGKKLPDNVADLIKQAMDFLVGP
ncbi:MAG: hypothetical protein ABFS86_15255 [Planctomycetota bacterium]